MNYGRLRATRGREVKTAVRYDDDWASGLPMSRDSQ
jgi:hypothetical protein